MRLSPKKKAALKLYLSQPDEKKEHAGETTEEAMVHEMTEPPKAEQIEHAADTEVRVPKSKHHGLFALKDIGAKKRK